MAGQPSPDATTETRAPSSSPAKQSSPRPVGSSSSAPENALSLHVHVVSSIHSLPLGQLPRPLTSPSRPAPRRNHRGILGSALQLLLTKPTAWAWLEGLATATPSLLQHRCPAAREESGSQSRPFLAFAARLANSCRLQASAWTCSAHRLPRVHQARLAGLSHQVLSQQYFITH